jgi:hypothetical protein
VFKSVACCALRAPTRALRMRAGLLVCFFQTAESAGCRPAAGVSSLHVCFWFLKTAGRESACAEEVEVGETHVSTGFPLGGVAAPARTHTQPPPPPPRHLPMFARPKDTDKKDNEAHDSASGWMEKSA